MNQMLVAGARLTAQEEEAWSAHAPHTETTESVVCAGRFIIKLSTGTSLAFRKWVKIRPNLEALQSQKRACRHVDVLSSFPLVGGIAACIQTRSAVNT